MFQRNAQSLAQEGLSRSRATTKGTYNIKAGRFSEKWEISIKTQTILIYSVLDRIEIVVIDFHRNEDQKKVCYLKKKICMESENNQALRNILIIVISCGIEVLHI